MRHLSVQSSMDDVEMDPSSASLNNIMPPQSPWHSPVPYLFGGIAAMIGLISFALLILACSYWRLSSSVEEDLQNDEEKERRFGDKAENGAFEDKFLVIMAGDDMPRFLATPAMKKCTCGGQEGKIVIYQKKSVDKEEGKAKEGEDFGASTSH